MVISGTVNGQLDCKLRFLNTYFLKDKIKLTSILTFSAHTINCVCHSIRLMFRVLGIYNFGSSSNCSSSIVQSLYVNSYEISLVFLFLFSFSYYDYLLMQSRWSQLFFDTFLNHAIIVNLLSNLQMSPQFYLSHIKTFDSRCIKNRSYYFTNF